MTAAAAMAPPIELSIELSIDGDGGALVGDDEAELEAESDGRRGGVDGCGIGDG